MFHVQIAKNEENNSLFNPNKCLNGQEKFDFKKAKYIFLDDFIRHERTYVVNYEKFLLLQHHLSMNVIILVDIVIGTTLVHIF